jgi:hypothetical protein
MLGKVATTLAVGLLVGTLGCKHGGETPTVARTPAGQARSAVREIADARCDREQHCENIGPDKKYATRDLCEGEVRNDWSDDLNGFDCPNGIVDAELDKCLLAIREDDCGSVLDALDRFTSCTVADICAD